MQRRTMALLVMLAATGVGQGRAQAAPAAFAPTGTKGNLRLTITVTGSGREGHRSGGYDSLRWTARHTMTVETVLPALEPMADTSSGNQAAIGATESAAREVFDEDAEAVQEKWDEKMDACDGSEACEMRVTAAMMADPVYRRIILKLQGGAGANILAKANAINYGPRYQIWGFRPTGPDVSPPSYRGTATLDRRQWRWGLVSTDGSGPSNDETRWARDGKLPSDIRPERGGYLTVDGQTGSYHLTLPADFHLAIFECEKPAGPCQATDSTTIHLLEGDAPEGKSLESLLTATGKVSDPANPSASGTLSFEPDRLGGSVKVTVEWSFNTRRTP
jgi:hypothetical protein